MKNVITSIFPVKYSIILRKVGKEKDWKIWVRRLLKDIRSVPMAKFTLITRKHRTIVDNFHSIKFLDF